MSRDCYWLRGGIQDERLVLWAFQKGKQVFWASIVETITGGIELVATLDRLKAAVFTIYSNEHSVRLTIFNNGTLYYVSGSESGTRGTSVGEFSVDPQWISITSTEVDPTSDVLSGANYFGSFFNLNFGVRIGTNGGNGNGNGKCCDCKHNRRYCNRGRCDHRHSSGSSSGSGSNTAITDTNDTDGIPEEFLYSFRFLPTIIYLLGDCNDPISDPNEITQLEENWVTSNKVIPKAFTNSTDCFTGVFYNYCNRGEGCSINCKGACEMGFACEYNVSERSFECIDPNPSNNEGDIFMRASFWFIFAIIIVIMSAIALVIGIYQYATRTVGEEVMLDTKEVINPMAGVPKHTLVVG